MMDVLGPENKCIIHEGQLILGYLGYSLRYKYTDARWYEHERSQV